MLLVPGRRLFVLLAALCGLLLAAGASATTISFEGIGANRSSVSQDFGDGGGLDLSYATVGGGSLLAYNAGYSVAPGVVYAECASCVGQITLAPNAGVSLTLDSISFAAWGPNRNTSFTVFNEDFSEVLYSQGFSLSAITQRSVGVSSGDAIHIQWGPNAYGVGITQIEVSMVSTPLAAPEPSLALLLAPAGLMALRRIRARA
ncbi:MAG: hypothetical protein QNK05_15780 [Myxococcota bacterium]|nr:hypothetical protein [Myxococcota bacterium]